MFTETITTEIDGPIIRQTVVTTDTGSGGKPDTRQRTLVTQLYSDSLLATPLILCARLMAKLRDIPVNSKTSTGVAHTSSETCGACESEATIPIGKGLRLCESCCWITGRTTQEE